MISAYDYNCIFEDMARIIAQIDNLEKLRYIAEQAEKFGREGLSELVVGLLRVQYNDCKDFMNNTVTPENIHEFNRTQGRLDVLTFFENLWEKISIEAQKRIDILIDRQDKIKKA